jgi:phospholipase C
VISPRARPDYVSHQVFDHRSVCAQAEAKWNMAALTYCDANAANMLDMIDLTRPAFATPPRLAKPLLDTDPGALACSTSGPGTIPPPGLVSPARAAEGRRPTRRYLLGCGTWQEIFGSSPR